MKKERKKERKKEKEQDKEEKNREKSKKRKIAKNVELNAIQISNRIPIFVKSLIFIQDILPSFDWI